MSLERWHEMDPIRQIVFQKQKTLRHIKSDIEQLQMEQKAIEMDLIPYINAFSPQNRIPDDVLSEIFILAIEPYGTVSIPFQKFRSPVPHLVLSHVCSRWRAVALQTSKLWNDVAVRFPDTPSRIWLPPKSLVQLDKWLMRAGPSPVRLSLCVDWSEESDDEVAHSIREIVSPFKFKKLDLCLTFSQFMVLLQNTTTLPLDSDIEKLTLKFTKICLMMIWTETFDMPHTTFSQLSSVAFLWHRGCSGLMLEKLSLPWSQLRYMDFGSCRLSSVVINILQQAPMLEELGIDLEFEDNSSISSCQALTMPCLQTLNSDIVNNEALQLFTCPVLTKLCLGHECPVTAEIYDIIKKQYNIKGLEEMPIFQVLPASSILKDAPLLQKLHLPESSIMDDEAITGIANGTLGCHLTDLWIDTSNVDDFDKVLEMVEARKRMVHGLLESGCIWRETITVLKHVEICNLNSLRSTFLGKYRWVYKERICALKEAGITITLPHSYYSN
ncbi:hypothetical protein APHAL10511_005660 [Amanita phalloides]|nr:hypothetical protein APHAL10511_005660 [Amanita phalloides]